MSSLRAVLVRARAALKLGPAALPAMSADGFSGSIGFGAVGVWRKLLWIATSGGLSTTDPFTFGWVPFVGGRGGSEIGWAGAPRGTGRSNGFDGSIGD